MKVPIHLSDLITGHANNFDLMRLVAALAVMFGHSYWIQPVAGRTEPILAFTGMEYSGSLAVYTFFLISGMLVTASYDRQRSPLRFTMLRVARVWPALIACVLVTLLVIYPLASQLAWQPTSRDAEAKFLLANVTLLGGVERVLPGIFAANAIPGVANGSLWTLPVEVKCYVLVLGLGLLGVVRRPGLLAMATAVAALLLIWKAGPSNGPFLRDMMRMPVGYGSYPVLFFILGMALYAGRTFIRIDGRFAIGLVAVYFALRTTPFGPLAFYVAFAYSILALGALPLLTRFAPRHDFSYGIYLWAFPVQQLVAMQFPQLGNLAALLIAVPATAAIAAGSWFLVERPALRAMRNKARARSQQTIIESNPAST